MPYTLNELEEALAARIAALDSTAHQQVNAPTGEVWAESDLPLTAMQDSVLQSHLAFSVSVEDAPVVEDNHAANGYLSVLATVSVVFLFRLRTDSQRADTRAAIQAAMAVAGAIMQPSAQWGSALPVNVYQPKDLEGEFLPVQQTYRVLLDVSIP